MATASHDSDDPRLTAYALGELTPAERAAVERDLAVKPELTDELAEIAAAGAALRRIFAAEEAPALLSAAQRQQLLAEARAGESGLKPETDSWLAHRRPLVAGRASHAETRSRSALTIVGLSLAMAALVLLNVGPQANGWRRPAQALRYYIDEDSIESFQLSLAENDHSNYGAAPFLEVQPLPVPLRISRETNADFDGDGFGFGNNDSKDRQSTGLSTHGDGLSVRPYYEQKWEDEAQIENRREKSFYSKSSSRPAPNFAGAAKFSDETVDSWRVKHPGENGRERSLMLAPLDAPTNGTDFKGRGASSDDREPSGKPANRVDQLDSTLLSEMDSDGNGVAADFLFGANRSLGDDNRWDETSGSGALSKYRPSHWRVEALGRKHSEDPALQAATCGGKYSELLARIEVADDDARYGQFYEYGLWPGAEYAGRKRLPKGYWVYVSPNWYIWGKRASE